MTNIELPKYYPEISLADELDRQRQESTERVAVPLGIDRATFQVKLPSKWPERGKNYDEYALKVPLISLDLTPFGFSWLQVTEAALYYDPENPNEVIKPFIWDELRKTDNGKDRLRVWRDPRKGIEPFPQVPHAVWIQDGTRYAAGQSPRDVRRNLNVVERAGDHFKGTSLNLLRPDMFKNMWWYFVGGQLGSGGVPYGYWDSGPGFGASWDADPYDGFRPLVSGSEYSVA